MEKNKIQIIKAPTGSGKTYHLIQNALFQTFCFQKTSIITTKNKHLVEQIYNSTCEIYKNEKINGQNISQKKITILKHTKDDHLSKNVLLDLFVQGNGIIITVHNYLYAFDDFYNTSFLNALTFVFPQLINVYFDEGDSYINNCYDNFTLFCSYVKQNDTLLQGSNYYSNESWAKCKNIDQAIKITPCYFYKSKSEDGSHAIKTNTAPYKDDYKIIEPPKFITGVVNLLKIKKIFGHGGFHEIPLSLKNIENETRTSTRYLLNIDESYKYLYMDKKNKRLIYNYLSTIFSNILKQHEPRNYETINSRFGKTFFGDEDIGDNDKSDSNLSPSQFLDQFSFTLKHIYFEKYLFLNEKEKAKFYKHFDKIYNIYAVECKAHKLLFGAKSLESGDEALLHLINTSLKSFLVYYCPYCKFYEIEVNVKGIDVNFNYIKVFKFKERKIKTADELYELKKNTDSLKFTSDFIKKKLFKSKKNTLKIDNQDQNINDSETRLNEISENKENLALSDDEFFASFDDENDLHQIMANKLKSKDYSKIRKELAIFVSHNPSALVEGNLKIKLIFSLINPEKFPPYGVELELLKDSDFSPRMLGEKRLITSANYDINCLETFKQLNIRFNAFANENLEHKFTEIVNSTRKVETLYILCGSENYHLKMIKKDFIKFYWNNFTKSFYYIFSKTENIKNKKVGMIALPSNKKVKNFYDYISFKNYASYLLGNDQTIESSNYSDDIVYFGKKFNPSQKLKEGSGLTFVSVFGTASTGVNIPHLFYLYISLHNYKPKYTHKNISVEINKKRGNPEFQIIQDSLIQMIGRMSRIDEFCEKQIKILEIYKKSPYKDMLYLNVLIANLKKNFTTIHLLDIEKYEKLAFSLYRSKKIYLYINKYKTDIINENYSINEILICGKYLSQFKISLIYLLKNKTNDENFNNLFKKQVYKYYFKLSKIAFMFIIGQMYDHFSNENPIYKKDIPYSKFKDKTNISKIPLYNDLYDYLKDFYNDVFSNEFDLKKFKKLYYFYKNNNKFNLKYFVKSQIENINFEIYKTF